VRLELRPRPAARTREVVLPLEQIDAREADAQLFRKVGLDRPLDTPVIGEVMPGGCAERAGLRNGDVVRR
jgi:regulator of sigma E protease